jgi:hypothetical protein
MHLKDASVCNTIADVITIPRLGQGDRLGRQLCRAIGMIVWSVLAGSVLYLELEPADSNGFQVLQQKEERFVFYEFYFLVTFPTRSSATCMYFNLLKTFENLHSGLVFIVGHGCGKSRWEGRYLTCICPCICNSANGDMIYPTP